MPYRNQLRRLRTLLRASRMVAALAMALGLAALLWLAFGLLDAAAAFETSARTLATTVLALLATTTALVLLVRALRVPAGSAARHADALTASTRAPAAAALSLDPDTATTPLARYLTERSLDEAAAALAALPARRIIDLRALRLAAVVLIVPLAAAGILRAVAPAPFAVVVQRLLQPSADIPPYSPLRFTIDPAAPAVVYGGEILITTEITGGTPADAVDCLIRRTRTGEILRQPAFRETPRRFSRTLDNLTEAVEVAFATGRARSSWTPVEILLEPNILGGIVRVTPPAYTLLPPTGFTLDTNEIAAVEGSEVTLELTSNRPLSAGTLVFTPAATPGETPETTTRAGEVAGSHSAAFTWTATRSGRLSATVRDLRGTPSPRPLELAFRCIPDQAPDVVLDSPPSMMLATPRSKIPVVGRASDDFALHRVHFVRTLAGFRDRARLVAPALSSRSYEFRDTLDLDELGLEPGQTIELMLDASDHNPSLLGQGSSEISRVRIISEEEYAAYIRARTTIEQFSSRFEALRDAIEEARRALENLREAPDREARAEALDAAREAHEKAAELMEKLADDFPAFDLEHQLGDLARENADALRDNLNALRRLDADMDDEQLRRALEPLLERLGRRQQQGEQLMEHAQLAAEAARLLEMAAKFRQIYENQTSLAKRFATIVEELRRGMDDNRRQLPMLGETQRKNRELLDEFKAELRRRIDALHQGFPQLAPLADSASRFLLELDVAEPETHMDAATRDATDGRAAEAFRNAELARAALERLLNEDEMFQQAARGEAPEFNIPNLDLNLQQLLEGLLQQNPGGDGEPGQGGPAIGGQGMAGGGFSMHLPMIGPDRMQFGTSPSPGSGGDGGDGPAAGAPPLPDTAESGTLRPTDLRETTTTAPAAESIPEPYRDAVRRFLTP